MLESMQKTVPDKVIESSLIVIGMAEAAHLTALFLKLPFGVCSTLFAALLMLGILWKTGMIFLRLKRGEHLVGQEGMSLNKLWKTYPGWIILPGLIIVLQMVWYYWIQEPYIKADITGEIVQTMLAADSIYEINPLTGQAFSAGMPMRLKILVLPTIFASVCKWTGIPAVTVCYSVVPGIVLLLSYTVYLGWAEYLFPQEEKKRVLFLLFTVLVYQFGAYSRPMDSFLLFFGGFQGEAFRTGIILPYALLCCLRRKWKGVLLCLLAEICVVWTFYGLGYTAVTVVVYAGVRLLCDRIDRRNK